MEFEVNRILPINRTHGDGRPSPCVQV